MTKFEPITIEIKDIDTLKDLWNRLNISERHLKSVLIEEYGEDNYQEFNKDSTDCYNIFCQLADVLKDLNNEN